jgi:cytoskeletal protein CcmA (bactofilin family)
MIINARQTRLIQHQTINEDIVNNGTLTLYNCVVNGKITGTGNLIIKGNARTIEPITPTNISIG